MMLQLGASESKHTRYYDYVYIHTYFSTCRSYPLTHLMSLSCASILLWSSMQSSRLRLSLRILSSSALVIRPYVLRRSMACVYATRIRHHLTSPSSDRTAALKETSLTLTISAIATSSQRPLSKFEMVRLLWTT